MRSIKPGSGLSIVSRNSRKKTNSRKSRFPEAVPSKQTPRIVIEKPVPSKQTPIIVIENQDSGIKDSDTDAVDEMTHGDDVMSNYNNGTSKKKLTELIRKDALKAESQKSEMKVNETNLVNKKLIFINRDEKKKAESVQSSINENENLNGQNMEQKEEKSKITEENIQELIDTSKFKLALPANSSNGSQGSKRPFASPNGSKRSVSSRLASQISDMDTERQLFEKLEKKPFKERMINNLKFINNHRKSMLIFNASDLTKEEPARKKFILSSFLKPLVMGIIAFLAFSSIVMRSISKLNTLKSQSLKLQKQLSFNFSMNNNTLPVHYFTELTEYQVTNRMGCLVRQDPSGCINYCDQIANITSQTDTQRWACYESKKVPTQLYGRSKCEKTNPNYLTTLTSKTAFLDCLRLNKQFTTFKEACVLQNDNNKTIYNCQAGCTNSSKGVISCDKNLGIEPDYSFCLLKQAVLKLTASETMSCFIIEAKLIINKTMCNDANKIQTYDELLIFANDQRAQQQQQVQNISIPLNLTDYPNCNISFYEQGDQVKSYSIDCMMAQQQTDRQNCYINNLPKNDELCVVLNGTNFRGYFECLNNMFDRPPKYADGCWIQQFYLGAQSQTAIISDPVENIADCYERSKVPISGEKCIYELEAYQLSQYLLVGNQPERDPNITVILPPDSGDRTNATDPNTEDFRNNRTNSTANDTIQWACGCEPELDQPGGLGGDGIGSPGQMGGVEGITPGGGTMGQGSFGKTSNQEPRGQQGDQTGNQVGQQGQGGQTSQGGGQRPGVQTKGGATQQQQSQGGSNQPQQSSQNQGGQNSGQSQPQQSLQSSSNGGGQQQQPSGNQQPSRGEPPSGGGAQGGGGGKGGGGRQLQDIRKKKTLSKALQCFQSKQIQTEYLQCKVKLNTYSEFSPFIKSTKVIFVNKTQDQSAQYCQQLYMNQVTAYSYDTNKIPPVEFMKQQYKNECQQIVQQNGQIQMCLQATQLINQIDDSISNSTLQIQNIQNNLIKNCGATFNQPSQYSDLMACEHANGVRSGIMDCFQGIHQNPKYFKFPKLNMFFCLRWKFNVQMPKSLIDCLGTEITITKTENCMEDAFLTNKYELSDDHQYYNQKSSLAKAATTQDYYRYYHNFTKEDITKFLCNNNMDLVFVTTPYQDSRTQGFTDIRFNAEEQTYAMDCQVLSYSNGTQNNVIVHNMFKMTPNKTMIPSKYKNYYQLSTFRNPFGLQTKVFTAEAAPRQLTELNMIINRTDSNQQVWKMTYTNNMNYISIWQETMIHYGKNTPNITSYKEYTTFTSSADATKIFQIGSWNIGLTGIAPINVNAETENQIYKGKQVTRKLFGYPISFNDTQNIIIQMETLNSVIESQRSVTDKNSVSTYLRMNFVENVYTFTYFNVMDLLSQLGGISATVQVGVGAIGFIFIVQYIAQLSGVAHRRKKEKYRLLKIKRISEHIDIVLEKVEAEVQDSKKLKLSPDERWELNQDLENSQKIAEMPHYTYPQQIKKYKILKNLFNKYLGPDYIRENVFTHEDKVKLDFYENLIKKEDHFKISADIQERATFYGKYKIYTKNKLTKVVIKDIRKYVTDIQDQTKFLENTVNSIQDTDGNKFSDMKEMKSNLFESKKSIQIKNDMIKQIFNRNEDIRTENDNLRLKMEQIVNQNQFLANQIKDIHSKDKLRNANEEIIFRYIQTIDQQLIQDTEMGDYVMLQGQEIGQRR